MVRGVGRAQAAQRSPQTLTLSLSPPRQEVGTETSGQTPERVRGWDVAHAHVRVCVQGWTTGGPGARKPWCWWRCSGLTEVAVNPLVTGAQVRVPWVSLGAHGRIGPSRDGI